MYPQLLAYLLQYIKYQHTIIITLLTIVLGRAVGSVRSEQPVNKPYQKLQIDELPILETPEKLSFQDLVDEFFEKNGKPLKPVRRHRNTKVNVPKTLCCPRCGAPSSYLYANNGDKGQFQCKVCACLFNKQSRYLKEAILKCPHCLKTLEKVKERKDFDVRCSNRI